jgi:putative hemolysin
MNDSWQFFLFIIILCLIVQGFFAMLEMATVSFNKIRLQYYVSQNNRRAIWLNDLLQHPGRLFGTCLVCINTALQIGSESARRFYEALGLPPDLAPISQVIIVLIFAEITPIFAGRRYAEHAAMLGAPILYAFSFVLRPVIWLCDALCHIIHLIIGKSKKSNLYLNREELQKILEEKDTENFNAISTQILNLRKMTAKELMLPLHSIQCIPSICTIAEVRGLLNSKFSPFVPIYHKNPKNIIAIAYPRDLLRLSENKKVRDHAKTPWFITEKETIMTILHQFRYNNQSVAIVLNPKGLASGILSLDEIVNQIFDFSESPASFEDPIFPSHHVVVDRAFPGSTLIEDFNKTYKVHLEAPVDFHNNKKAETLEELVMQILGHLPVVGESITIDQFELTIQETSLLGATKTISVRTFS